MRAPGKTMTQDARSALPSRKKPPPTAANSDGHSTRARGPSSSTIRLPCNCCNRENSRGPWPLLRNSTPAPPRSRNGAGCTSSPASAKLNAQPHLRHPEEHYDYAVSQFNTGYYEEAREQFNNILTGHPERRLRLLRPGCARRNDRPDPGMPRQSGPGHRAESKKPPSGACGQRLSKHGGRPPLYRIAVS